MRERAPIQMEAVEGRLAGSHPTASHWADLSGQRKAFSFFSGLQPWGCPELAASSRHSIQAPAPGGLTCLIRFGDSEGRRVRGGRATNGREARQCECSAARRLHAQTTTTSNPCRSSASAPKTARELPSAQGDLSVTTFLAHCRRFSDTVPVDTKVDYIVAPRDPSNRSRTPPSPRRRQLPPFAIATSRALQPSLGSPSCSPSASQPGDMNGRFQNQHFRLRTIPNFS